MRALGPALLLWSLRCSCLCRLGAALTAQLPHNFPSSSEEIAGLGIVHAMVHQTRVASDDLGGSHHPWGLPVQRRRPPREGSREPGWACRHSRSPKLPNAFAEKRRSSGTGQEAAPLTSVVPLAISLRDRTRHLYVLTSLTSLPN